MSLSTAFHPRMDGKAKRTIKNIEDMLRTCIIELKGNKDKHFPLVEFS